MRAVFLARLEHQYEARRSTGEPLSKIEETISLIRAEGRGSFSSFTSNPVVGAILTPFGGMGSIQLAEMLLTIN